MWKVKGQCLNLHNQKIYKTAFHKLRFSIVHANAERSEQGCGEFKKGVGHGLDCRKNGNLFLV